MAEVLSRFPIDLGSVPIYVGDSTNLLTARVLEDDGVTPVDLMADWNDWEASWRLYPTAADSIPLTVTVTGEEITISLTPAQSREMGGRCGFFDVQAVSKVGGEIRTWFKGSTDPSGDVTR